jgi:hypothetical protein
LIIGRHKPKEIINLTNNGSLYELIFIIIFSKLAYKSNL